MASTTANINQQIQTAIPMARFSIGEDEDEAPFTNKRPRLTESSSQLHRSCQRSQSQSQSQSQPRVVGEEYEEVQIEQVESEEEEEEDNNENEDEYETGDEDEEIVSDEEVSEEEVEVVERVESEEDVSDREEAEGGNRQRTVLGMSDVPVGNRTGSSGAAVFNNAVGELQVVLTDPDVLDCPICLDPLSTPVFQCENGHIACSLCCSKVKQKCPSCCMPIGYNRCRAIEKVIESVKISCKNAQYGCKETMTYSKKVEHELMCPHATCFCPHPSCPFVSSSKKMYLHFGIQHAASTTRFTYNITFTVHVTTHQKHIFLQEQHESVIFILNHQSSEQGRALNVDCVGPSTLKTSFEYQITAKNMDSTLSLQCVPEIHTRWSEHPLKKNYLTVPSDFFGYSGTLPLHICIKKVVSTM